VPLGLTGLDREATWSYSPADGWVYGHGSFCLTSYKTPLLGRFVWMPNSAHEAKRLKSEIASFAGLVEKVFMDSKADDQKLYFHLRQEHHIQLVTVPRAGMDKSPERQRMIKQMLTKQNRKDYKQRSTTVEPMQGLVKEIFDLHTCWMRGDANNRWLFAAMGIAVQIAQLHAYRKKKSTWHIKSEVLGL
jgi:Transposase DDE domain